MIKYALRRVLISIPVILIITILCFGLLRLAPGDAADALVPPEYATPANLAVVRKEYGLDKPLPVQYIKWLGKAAQGDLGESISGRVPVTDMIRARLPVTLELAAAALILSTILGLTMGVLSAVRQGKAADSAVRLGSLVGVSVPGFVWGIGLIMLFGWYYSGIIPYGGWVPISASLGKNLSHLILPAVALTLATAGIVARLGRSSMLDVLGRDYIAAAAAYGVPRRKIVLIDALKNALLPVITVLGLTAAHLVGGVVVTETIFGLPGLGLLLVTALQTRDYPLASGIVLIFSVMVVLMNLVVDLLYAGVNPRIAHSYRVAH